MNRVLVATSNPGKIRDLIGAARAHNVEIAPLPHFASLPAVVEDGLTFEANARKKAEHYSKCAEGEIVIADDSGLEVDALKGAPGVRSARYAADEHNAPEHAGNSDDEANNARLLRELRDVPDEFRTGRFVCVIAAARNGHTLATFHGTAEGVILHAPRGSNGFGYDPLFYFPEIGKTFAELTAEEKAGYSHRGAAFRAFLAWEDESVDRHPHR
jgi:XTP/dITP diphosphohydrolase